MHEMLLSNVLSRAGPGVCLKLFIFADLISLLCILYIMLLSLYIVTAYLEVLFLPLYDGVTALYSFVVCLWIKNNRINSF